MRALIDTNVLLDYVLPREQFPDVATEIWKAHLNGRFEGYMAGITPINAFYIGRKIMGGAEPARKAVTRLVTVWNVCPVTQDVLRAAVVLPIADFEDAVQVASAKAHGIDILITRDLRDYEGRTIRVFSPQDFLDFLNRQSKT